MREFRVSVCAVEANPNFNEAHRFAHEFPGKVFRGLSEVGPPGTIRAQTLRAAEA
jgi:hypothetical protein